MTLAPCPCGKTPTDLRINTIYSAKWGQVSGDCCGEWIIEFHTEYKKEGTAELHELAVQAWNEAERGQEAVKMSIALEAVNRLVSAIGSHREGLADDADLYEELEKAAQEFTRRADTEVDGVSP